jgi:hypothetical protein
MATTPKKPSAAPVATVAPAATKTAVKKAVATKTATAKKVVAPVAAPVTTPAVVAKKAPATVKPAAKKVSATATKLKPSTAPAPILTVEQRNHYVSVAAFYIAERRGFTLGNPAEDWLAAEAEVDRLIASGHFTA